MKLEIVEMLHIPTNKKCYEVLDNDGHIFPSYGVYWSKKQAIEVINAIKFNRSEIRTNP